MYIKQIRGQYHKVASPTFTVFIFYNTFFVFINGILCALICDSILPIYNTNSLRSPRNTRTKCEHLWKYMNWYKLYRITFISYLQQFKQSSLRNFFPSVEESFMR